MMNGLQVEVAPEEVGMSSERLQRIRPLLQQYIDSGKLGGIVTLVARHGQIVHLECLGARDLEAADPMRPNTIFRIYSMTKPVASVAALILYEEGRFQLDDPVHRYIPGFRDVRVYTPDQPEGVAPKRPVTVRDLFLHTAGIGMNPGGSSPLGAYFRDAGLDRDDMTLAEMVERRLQIPLLHHPGDDWSYGSATDVLAHLVELLSEQRFDTFLEERIFEPLGMEDTGFYVPPEKHDRLATVYGPPRGGKLVVLDRAPTSVFARPRQFLSGSAGLVSTVADYYRFAEMLRGGGAVGGVRILGRKSVEMMTQNHLADHLIPYRLPWRHLAHYTVGCGYGLGVRVVHNPVEWGLLGSVGEFGWAGANNTFFWVDPHEGMTLMLFTQFEPFMHYALDRQFKVLAYQAIQD